MNITEESQQIQAFFEEAARRKMGEYGSEQYIQFDYLYSTYTTDQMFEMLPSFVYHNGYNYHFNLIKSNKGVTVFYAKNDVDGGEKLGKTSRQDFKLKSALIRMYIFLKEQKYI